MRNRVVLSALGAGLIAALGLAGAPAKAQSLTVVSWGGAYQEAQKKIYFEPFAKAKALKLLDEAWDGGVGVIRAKVQAAQPTWDVVQVEAEELVLGCEEGLYEKIDWAKLGGKDKFIPAAVNDCGVGAIVWSTAIAYDGDKLKEGPKSWADFWDLKKFPGKRSLRGGPKYTLEFALMADGVSVNDVYKVLATPAGVERAFKKLDEIKSQVVWWKSGAQPIQLLASGEVVMTSAYNGRVSAANRTDKKNFKVVWPGSIYAVDSWVVLKNSANKGAGMDYIAFASAPENQKNLPEYIAYGLTNKAAVGMVDAKYQAELPTTPANAEGAIPINANFWVENIDKLTERFNAWAAK